MSKKKNRLEEYWKKKGFDSGKELLIYQYLCNNLSSRRTRKIDEEHRFCEYRLWREHIESIVQSYKEDELTEFYHFIRLKERKCGIGISIIISFLMPFVIAYITVAIGEISNNISSFTLEVFCVLFIIFYTLIPYIHDKNQVNFWSDCLEIIEEKYKKEG